VLPDAAISRCHCQFQVISGKPTVTDLGSSNGSFLDGQRMAQNTPLVLWDGARVEIGSHVLSYVFGIPRDLEMSVDLEDDLEKASQYVQSLLPPAIPFGDIRTDWFFQPSAKVGGDAFGYQYLDQDHFALYLMDVSGHGTAAALHTVSVMNLLRHRALPDTDFKQPAQVIASLNAMFQMEDHGGMFFTMWYGVYDKRARSLSYSSAGQHPAYLVPRQRDHSLPLGTKGLMVGAMPGYRFQTATALIPPGSRVYLFSDGVFEISTREGGQWRLADFLPLLLDSSSDDTGEGLRLSNAVRSVARPGPLDDDFSMLVVTFP
jgi:serine phosphatase RsbU (regulator of sigma subunit)